MPERIKNNTFGSTNNYQHCWTEEEAEKKMVREGEEKAGQERGTEENGAAVGQEEGPPISGPDG